MFNLDKESRLSNVDQLAQEANNTVEKVTDQIKSSTAKASEKVMSKAEESKDQAQALIESFRNLLDDYKQTSKVNELKAQLHDKAVELKDTITNEANHAYTVTKQRATDSVRENPIGTLALVAGAGLLLGYVLGSKQSSK